MSLKKRFLFIMVTLLLVITTLSFVTGRFTFIKSFESIEKDYVIEKLEATFTYVDALKNRMKGHVRDWAAWDETYQFISAKDPEYKERNLVEDTFKNISVSWMIYLDIEGKIIEEAGLNLPVIPEFRQFITEHGDLWKFSEPRDSPRLGLFASSMGLIIYASAPIVTSKFEGPILGTLILARIFDEKIMSDLVSIMGVPVVVSLDNSPEKTLQKKETIVEAISKDRIRAKGKISVGSDSLTIESELPRKIYLEARKAETIFALSLLGAIAVVIGILWYFVNRKFIQELHELREESLKKATIEGNIPEFDIEKFSTEEFRNLAEAFNVLVKKQEMYFVELLEHEKQLATILSSLPVGGILISQDDRTVLWVNKTFERITGILEEHIVGKHIDEIPFLKSFLLYASDMRDVKKHKFKESQIITADGQRKDVLESVVPIIHKGKRCIFEAFIDVTEQKQLEEKLRRAEKLEAVGLVAGSVAHELNNILTSLVIYPEMLLYGSSFSAKERHYLETIIQASLRASELVNDLLTMTRRQLTVRDVISISSVLREVVDSPEMQNISALRPFVKFDFSQAFLDGYVLGSKTHLMRAIINLIKNASEAVEGRGYVSVKVSRQELPHDYNGYELIPCGNYIVIEVSDTGKGIPSEHLPRIFEPFYTTKKLGLSGTGLGMTVVWNVVKDMDGYIDIDSTPGKGTVIRLFLPEHQHYERRHGDVAMKTEIPVEIKDLPLKSTLSVLVVDDRPDQREIASIILKEIGVDVATASDMDGALSLIRSRSFDLVLLDMILSDKYDGLDVAREILREKPGQPIVIVSGYGESDRVKQALKEGVLFYIRKPYRKNDIIEVIRKIQ